MMTSTLQNLKIKPLRWSFPIWDNADDLVVEKSTGPHDTHMPKIGMKIQAVNFKSYAKPRTHVPVATTSLHYCLKKLLLLVGDDC